MDKVLIWGIGNDFWQLYNVIKAYEALGNFEIVGYISKNQEVKYIDRCEVLKPEDIIVSGIGFDYIIVCSNRYYKEIAGWGGIDRKKFINGKVFRIPHFDWNKYKLLYESNMSIIAEMCIGGILSNCLGLPFNSPFVNVRSGIEKNDYFNLLDNLDYYMTQSPKDKPLNKSLDRNWNGWDLRVDIPKLWYDNIMIHGYHFRSQDELFEIFEKRRKRYNPKNKFILKILFDEEDVEKFEMIECKSKIGFYYKDTSFDNIITVCPERFPYSYAYQYSAYISDILRYGNLFEKVDIFDLLTKNIVV
jgi:uncharacterized protein (DUF1919 family)